MSVGHCDVLLPLRPGSLRELRQWARTWLGRHPTGVDPDAVLLAMTEAVTNSVRHGSPPVSVDLMDDPPNLWMQVNDGSDVLPRNHGPGVGQEGGRGLDILEAVTDCWGVTVKTHGGKTVWCEFQGGASTASGLFLA